MKRLFRLIVLTGFLLLCAGSAFGAARIIDFLLAGVRDPDTDTVLSGGTVTVTEAGTSNAAYVWDDWAKTLPTTTGRSTITLDAYGKAEVYGADIYKFVIKSSLGVEITGSPIDYADYGGTISSTPQDPSVRPESYGATADAITASDGAITATDKTFTSAGAAFASADVGAVFAVAGAGAAGADLITTVASVTTGTEIELTAAATTTVSSASYIYGTDNATAFQDAADAAYAANTADLVFSPGSYLFGTTLDMHPSSDTASASDGVSILGAGADRAVLLYFFGSGYAISYQKAGDPDDAKGYQKFKVSGISIRAEMLKTPVGGLDIRRTHSVRVEDISVIGFDNAAARAVNASNTFSVVFDKVHLYGNSEQAGHTGLLLGIGDPNPWNQSNIEIRNGLIQKFAGPGISINPNATGTAATSGAIDNIRIINTSIGKNGTFGIWFSNTAGGATTAAKAFVVENCHIEINGDPGGGAASGDLTADSMGVFVKDVTGVRISYNTIQDSIKGLVLDSLDGYEVVGNKFTRSGAPTWTFPSSDTDAGIETRDTVGRSSGVIAQNSINTGATGWANPMLLDWGASVDTGLISVDEGSGGAFGDNLIDYSYTTSSPEFFKGSLLNRTAKAALSAGTATTNTASHLVDTGATFSTDNVFVGCTAFNLTDKTSVNITNVTETDLTLASDAFPDGDEEYVIYDDYRQQAQLAWNPNGIGNFTIPALTRSLVTENAVPGDGTWNQGSMILKTNPTIVDGGRVHFGWTKVTGDATNVENTDWAKLFAHTEPITNTVDVTDSSGGTSDGTLAAISGSGDDADINNNFADLAAKLNKLLQDMRALGYINAP